MKLILMTILMSLSLSVMANDEVKKCLKLNLEGSYVCADPESDEADLVISSSPSALTVDFTGEPLIVDGNEHGTDGDKYRGYCTASDLVIEMEAEEGPVKVSFARNQGSVQMTMAVGTFSFGALCRKL